MNIKEKLIRQRKTRWLDIGCGGNFEKGFYYLDIFPRGVIGRRYRDKYFRMDIVNASKEELKNIGKFNFIRMQHTLEHFSVEEGQQAIRNCAKLLKREGILLITTPDLRIHIKKYLEKKYKSLREFSVWAKRRISDDAPGSFYFSVFAHGIHYGGEHKWCYDFEGIKYQLQSSGEYKDIKRLAKDDPLANIPFTHNRPEQDLCVMATKSNSNFWRNLWRKNVNRKPGLP